MLAPLLRLPLRALRRLPLLTLACVALLVGCPPADQPGTSTDPTVEADDAAAATKRIVILTNGDDPFWDACQAGAEAAAEELDLASKGYRLSFERADFTVEGQVEKLRQYQTAGDVAALGISVYDSSAASIARELKKLREAGTHIVTIDGDLDRDRYRDLRTAYLGTDNIIGGRELGRAAAGLKPDGGKFVTFVGNESAANAIERIAGFEEGAGERFEKLATKVDGSDEVVARDRVKDAFDQYPDVDTLVGIWAYNAPAAVQIAEKMGKLDDVIICSFDAAEKSIAAMEAGKVDVMVVQNPFNMGNEGVRLLLALCESDEAQVAEMYPDLGDADQPDGDLRRTGLKVVVPPDSPLTPDLFDEQTEFLTLEEFQAWLRKYNLRSS